MSTKQVKMDIYTLKAIESKGFDINELIKLSDSEIREVSLSVKLINHIIDYKKRIIDNNASTEVDEMRTEIFTDIVAAGIDDSTFDAHKYKEKTQEEIEDYEDIKKIDSVELKNNEKLVIIPDSDKDILNEISTVINNTAFKNVKEAVSVIQEKFSPEEIEQVNSDTIQELIMSKISKNKRNKANK